MSRDLQKVQYTSGLPHDHEVKLPFLSSPYLSLGHFFLREAFLCKLAGEGGEPNKGESKIGVGVFTFRHKISILFSIILSILLITIIETYFNRPVTKMPCTAGKHSSGAGQTEAEQQISRHVAGVGEKDDFRTRLHCGKVIDSHRECTTYIRNITRLVFREKTHIKY
jgi:hypothetical protein